ncbi:hypothetical protein [Flavobacterium silvaticum]|uniref:Uncharacterized protein n=1 Tax=Flavobacterium silvaticum TaxID=1852020 RepID=A0A972FVP3_9FLAO|nr:hypothetical protein [Flavobacterium silvaticum]NMH28475.1 hypothetical protein [Flavobacterium silvaticum]
MKFLYVLLPFCVCASAQTFSIDALSLPSSILANSPKPPAILTMTVTDFQITSVKNYTPFDSGFLKDRKPAVRALRQNLEIADPMMKPVYIPGGGWQGTAAGGALEMLSPRTDYSNY